MNNRSDSIKFIEIEPFRETLKNKIGGNLVDKVRLVEAIIPNVYISGLVIYEPNYLAIFDKEGYYDFVTNPRSFLDSIGMKIYN